ncbi:MAG: trypsin-like peptidase domain-containing protein [Pseudomonadota bacterium]
MRDFARFVLLPAAFGIIVGTLLLTTRGATSAAVPQPGQGFAAAVRTAAPSVVNIYTSQRRSPALCARPEYEELCERLKLRRGERVQSSLGSGVIVSSNGYILTNNHVVADADEVLVAFHDGQATTAEVVGTDLETDLALIRVQASGLATIPVGRSADVAVGDIALAIGNPFGLGQTVSAGIISAKGRIGITASPYADFLQTDAAINLGNSGGALVDSQGRLIGINTLIFSRSGGSEGIGFAIPVDLALGVVQKLASTGEVVRGWLGIELAPSPAPGAASGLEVTRLLEAGPAAQAGLLIGDRLMAVNNVPAQTSSAVGQQIADVEPGRELALDVNRDGELLRLIAVPVQRPRLNP